MVEGICSKIEEYWAHQAKFKSSEARVGAFGEFVLNIFRLFLMALLWLFQFNPELFLML